VLLVAAALAWVPDESRRKGRRSPIIVAIIEDDDEAGVAQRCLLEQPLLALRLLLRPLRLRPSECCAERHLEIGGMTSFVEHTSTASRMASSSVSSEVTGAGSFFGFRTPADVASVLLRLALEADETAAGTSRDDYAASSVAQR
jgi:hypothetical protein